MPEHPDLEGEAAALRERELFERLAILPIDDVSGVVSGRGSGGHRSGAEELWTLDFVFDAWRLNGSNVETEPLTVRKKVTDDDLHTFRDAIKQYEVLHVKARVLRHWRDGMPQALLETLIGIDTSDAELVHHAAELQKPVTFEDSKLGTFTLDRRIDWFSSTIDWRGSPIPLYLAEKETVEVQKALKLAHTLWESQTAWDARARDFAMQELLPLKNDTWLEEDEDEVTGDEFKERISLESITVHSDGTLVFGYTDGDLFWGHWIEVRGNTSEGLTVAGIAG